MSAFKDITIFTTDNGLKTKYQELYKEERRERRLLELRKEIFDFFFCEVVKVFKKELVKNQEKHEEFFLKVSNIKGKGIKFFEELLLLEIPEMYNKTLISSLVINKEELYTLPLRVIHTENDELFSLDIEHPDFVFLAEGHYSMKPASFTYFWYDMDINIEWICNSEYNYYFKCKTEEEFLKQPIKISTDWEDRYEGHKPSKYFYGRGYKDIELEIDELRQNLDRMNEENENLKEEIEKMKKPKKKINLRKQDNEVCLLYLVERKQ